MDKLRLGIAQMNTQDSVEASLQKIEELTTQCVQDGAQLVAFPEYSTYLADAGKMEHAETLDGPIISFFKKLAQKHNIYIHNGSFIEKSDIAGKAHNTSVFINPKGEIEAVYRKIHLFDVQIPGGKVSFKESNTIVGGDRVVTLDTALGHFGFTICYDLRFPDLFQTLTNRGAKLIFVPAAFTLYTGKDHWETLLRARAIENQVYIVAIDQFGEHPERKMCYGNSMVIDPWGTVIAKATERVGYVVADIDWSYQEQVRANLPCLEHKVSFK